MRCCEVAFSTELASFSACFPNVAMAEVTDYCGLVVGRKADKSGKCQHCLAVYPTAALSIFGKIPEQGAPHRVSSLFSRELC